MTDHESCIALNSIPGIGYVTFTELVKYFGSPAKIAGHAKCEYMQVKKVGEKLAAELENTDLERAMARERDLAAQRDIKIIAITDPEYPAILREIPSPPIVLYVAGKLPAFERSLGVVGSRNITSYAKEQTSSISFAAAANGRATKIIIPSEIQGLVGLASGLVESVKEPEAPATKPAAK